MSYTPAEFVNLMLSIVVLMLFAHGGGYIFSKLKQPQVVGEILGGLLLGPTFLQRLFPDFMNQLFFTQSSTQAVLGAIYQLGVIHLMFCSGLEIRTHFQANERRLVTFLVLFGTLLPFVLSWVVRPLFSQSQMLGEAQNELAMWLIFALAVSITSIPVISRILHDLDLLKTGFARVVLTSAVVEDIALYVVLTLTLSLAGAGTGQHFGVGALLQGQTEWVKMVYHAVVSLGFFGASLWAGPRFFKLVDRSSFNVLRKANPFAFLIAFMLAVTSLAASLGIAPMFGAFVAGLVVQGADTKLDRAKEDVKAYSFGIFIPIYFALVGMKLDLLKNLNLKFFAMFFAVACVIKLASTFAGARFAGVSNKRSLLYSVAMNARGGPGIVLASLSRDAKIISSEFYTALIILAITTSCIAGSVLQLNRHNLKD
ncbi:MAG: cation:proton antiporter [Oligoflexia bacterium]|nr:cation:proton antiporter [Oligoflexia bacterium]